MIFCVQVLQKLVRQLTTSSGERSSMFNGADQLAEEIVSEQNTQHTHTKKKISHA